jgi:hypothetical protein
MAEAAVALAHEDPEPAPGRGGIASRRGAVAAREGVAELVERRAARSQPLDVGGQRLAHVDQHALVVGLRRRRRPIRLRVEAG